MSTDNLDQLDRILAEDVDRRAKKQAVAKAQAEEEARWRHRCTDRLRETVLPTLKEFATRVAADGHEVNLSERLDGYIYPNLEFSLAPKRLSPGRRVTHSFPSSITFICAESQQIEIRNEITLPDGSRVYGSLPSPAHDLEELSAELVEQTLLRFVDVVLDAAAFKRKPVEERRRYLRYHTLTEKFLTHVRTLHLLAVAAKTNAAPVDADRKIDEVVGQMHDTVEALRKAAGKTG